jgi:hypothetical protein
MHMTQELFRLITLLNDTMLSLNDRDEVCHEFCRSFLSTNWVKISMFQAVASSDLSRLLELGRKFCLGRTNYTAAVLCLDHVFKISNQATNLSGQLATTNLPSFFDYARLIKKVALDVDPSKDAAVQKLLGIRLLSSNNFLIPGQTELYNLLKSSPSPIQLRETDKGLVLPGRELSKVVKGTLGERLRKTLSHMGTIDMMKGWPLSTTLLFIRRDFSLPLRAGAESLAIRQVIHDKLPFDTTALCSIIEYACGFLVVSMSCSKPNVRGVDMPRGAILPRTWFQAALTNLPKDRIIKKSPSYVLVEPLTDLLQRVASRSDAGLYFVFCTIGGR